MRRKKFNGLKRVVSIILSLTLIFGVVGSITQREAKAASDPQKVTLTLTKVDDGGHWYFSQSGLSGDYLGGKRYRFDAVADGKATSQDRIVFYDKEVTIWSTGFQTKKPTTSYYIPAGTVLYQWDGSSDENMADGYQLVLAEDFYAECIDGVWTQTEITKDVTLELTSADSTEWSFSHSELSEEYQGASNGKSPVRYLVESYVDGGSTPVVDKIRFDGAKASIYTNTFTKTPTASYYIPAGTILKEWDTNTTDSPKLGGKQLRLTEDFYAVYEDGVWTQTKITPEDVTLELTEVDKNGDWNFSHSELPEEYQGASSSPVRYLVEAYVDGSSTPVVDKIKFSGDTATIFTNTFAQAPTTSYYIPAGTILYQWDGSSTTYIPGGKQLVLTEDFYVVNTNDTWIRTEFQTVTLELTEVDINGDWNFSHSELTEEYQGASSGKSPVRYLVESYVDGGSTPLVDKIRFDGAKAIIYANTFTKKPTTSYYIPAGTILREWDTSTTNSPKAGGKQMKLTASFEVVYEEGAWVQKIHQEEVTLSFDETDSEGTWKFQFDNTEMRQQGKFTFSAYVDGVEQIVEMDFNTTEANNAYIYSGKFGTDSDPISSLLIPMGTVMTNKKDGNLTCIVKNTMYVEFTGSTWETSSLQGVSLELEAITSDMWDLSHSELTEEYQGVSDDSSKFAYYEFEVYLDDASTPVKDFLVFKGTTLQKWFNTLPNKTTPAASYYIPKGTLLYQYNATTGERNGIVLEMAEDFRLEKFGDGWMDPTWPEHTYPDNDNVFAHSLDTGVYLFTSSGAMMVTGQPDSVTDTLVSGSTVNTPGEYSVVKYENKAKFNQIIVLYKRGDANLDNEDVLSVVDLVDAKRAQESAKETSLARWYAADVDADGVVEADDMELIRKILVGAINRSDYAVNNNAVALLNENVMPIIGYNGPSYYEGLLNGSDYNTMTDTVYGYIGDLGINVINWVPYQDYNDTSVRSKIIENLKLAEKYGIGMYLYDDFYHKRNVAGDTVEVLKTKLPARLGMYDAYKSFLGIHIVDEPHTLEHGGEALKDLRPLSEYETVIQTMAGYNNVSGWVNIDRLPDDTFASYLGIINNTGVDMLSYDYYPITVTYSTESQTWIKNTEYALFYDSLNTARTKSLEYNKPFWCFAQVGHSVHSESTIPDEFMQTASELQWEVNASLAFGAKAIQYYSLVQGFKYSGLNQKTGGGTLQANRQGLIDLNGNKNTRYYDAALQMNHYIAEIDEVLMPAISKGVVSNDSHVTAYATEYNDDVLSVSGESGSTYLAGCFDYRGKNAYLICNTNVTSDGTYDIKFDNVYGYKLYQQSTRSDINYCLKTDKMDSGLKITIRPGQSVLIVLE